MWDEKEYTVSLPTLTAIPLLALGCQMQELKDGEYFLREICRLSEDTQLFMDGDKSLIAGASAVTPKIWERAKAHVAWGVFGWIV